MSLTKVSYSMISGATINALDYGAVGDGVTDNTAAFAAANTALVAQGGGCLYIPKGVYKYTAFFITGSNICVRGDGMGQTVLRPQGWVDGIRFAYTYVVPTAILTNVGIEHVTVDGTDQDAGASDTNGNGINIHSCATAWVRFCEVKKTKQQAIVSSYFALENPPESFQEAYWVTDNLIDNSLSLQIAIGLEGLQKNTIISRNIIHNVNGPSGVGIFCAANGITPGVITDTSIISDNIIDGTQGVGIKVEGVVQEVIVSGNKIIGCNWSIALSWVDGPDYTRNYIVSNNQLLDWEAVGFVANGILDSKTIFTGNSLISSVETPYAMIVGENFFISNNRLEVSTGTGILMVADGSVVSNNYIFGPSVYCIDAGTYTATNSVISGNVCSNQIFSAPDTKLAGNIDPAPTWNYNYIGAKQSVSNPNGNLAPVSGTWAVGDKVWNTEPASGIYIGWTCTVAGTPGTWKEFGLIA